MPKEEKKKEKGFLYMVNELGFMILQKTFDEMVERDQDLSLAMGKDCVK